MDSRRASFACVVQPAWRSLRRTECGQGSRRDGTSNRGANKHNNPDGDTQPNANRHTNSNTQLDTNKHGHANADSYRYSDGDAQSDSNRYGDSNSNSCCDKQHRRSVLEVHVVSNSFCWLCRALYVAVLSPLNPPVLTDASGIGQTCYTMRTQGFNLSEQVREAH